MYFWKIDEETIRCLVNEQEIDSMGYDIDELNKDDNAMEDFLNKIIDESLQYVDWNPEHGLQNYAARVLPADQLLVTISCTYPDELIDKDLEQIERISKALKRKVTQERIDEIYRLSGDEKQRAFDELAKDLHAIYGGQIDEEEKTESPSNKKYFYMIDQIIVFSSLEDVSRFCHMVPRSDILPATLYKVKESYELLVRMSACSTEKKAESFLSLARECGGMVRKAGLREAYLKEHGKVVIRGNAIEKL